MRAGNRLELLKALELALEGFRRYVPVVPDDFHSAQRPDNAAREPHLAIGTGRDGAEQFVIGNQVRRLMVHG